MNTHVNVDATIEDDIIQLVRAPKNISEVVANLQEADIHTQAHKYQMMMLQEAEDLVSQLRHRANMMRIRAEEFDVIADNLSKFSGDLHGKVTTFSETFDNTKDILQAHAHINPTKVTGE
jgi:hypothetical protein